jgi:flagellar biosynthesis protein FlhF
MNLVPFIAASASDAVGQIRRQLGPEAVVVHVRPLPVRGWSRWWRKPRFEVMAFRPDPLSSALDLTSDAVAQPSGEPADAPRAGAAGLRRQRGPVTAAAGAPGGDDWPTRLQAQAGSWRIGPVLERAGFLPSNAQRVLDQLQESHGEPAPASLAEELGLLRAALSRMWRKPFPFLEDSLRPHILVGPPGIGKTTCLCKWLAQAVLVEGRQARVWRLDGAGANTSEMLSVYCEVLGVPLERSWEVKRTPGERELWFLDVPGVDWRSEEALQGLARQLRDYLSPHVHLVLNGAYDMQLLLAQVRAFGVLPLEDLVVTHLDEEARWGKIWNLVLGTNYSVRFLSAGQNIPGDFLAASPEDIFARQFPA